MLEEILRYWSIFKIYNIINNLYLFSSVPGYKGYPGYPPGYPAGYPSPYPGYPGYPGYPDPHKDPHHR